MNIKIDEDYSIKNSDERNITLVKNRIAQEGKNAGTVQESVVGYYGTVQATLKDYMRIKVNQSYATSVPELLRDIKKIEKTIETVLNGN